jgi:hypothetical protein
MVCRPIYPVCIRRQPGNDADRNARQIDWLGQTAGVGLLG